MLRLNRLTDLWSDQEHFSATFCAVYRESCVCLSARLSETHFSRTLWNPFFKIPFLFHFFIQILFKFCFFVLILIYWNSFFLKKKKTFSLILPLPRVRVINVNDQNVHNLIRNNCKCIDASNIALISASNKQYNAYAILP